MPAPKVQPEAIDQQLLATFKRLGYDGTSMEALAEATGLKKASLYHRFPGGKKEMALAVIHKVKDAFAENVTKVLLNKNIPLPARLNKALATFHALYNGGTGNCVLRVLLVSSDAGAFKKDITACFNLLIRGFESVAVENGLPKKLARERAKEVIITIQGTLLLSTLLNDKALFKERMASIPGILSRK